MFYSLLIQDSTYKGCKIDWDEDECAAPLQRPLQSRTENISPKENNPHLKNRFQLLNLDTEDDTQDDHDANEITFEGASTGSPIGIIS